MSIAGAISRGARRLGAEWPKLLVALGIVVVTGTFAFIGYNYVPAGDLTAEESCQPLASRLVLEGRIPFRDFAYDSMPLTPYLTGLATALFDHGLTAHRVTNLIAAGLGLALVALAAGLRLRSFEAALTAGFLVAASAQWVSVVMKEASLAYGGLFLSVSLLAALAPRWPRARPFVFAVSSALAIYCNLAAAPIALALAVVLIVDLPGRRQRVVALVSFAAALLALTAPFAILAAPEIVFFNWTVPFAAEVRRHGMLIAVECWQLSSAGVLVLLTGAMGAHALLVRRQVIPLILLGAAVVGYVTPLVPADASGHHVALAVPVAAAAGVIAVWSTGQAGASPFRCALWLFPLIALLYPLPRLLETTPKEEIAEVVKAIERKAPEGPLLTPTPVIAVIAGRAVLPGTERGMFSAMGPRDSSVAERLELTTLIELTASVRAREPAAIVKMRKAGNWNFRWAVPQMRRQPRTLLRNLKKAIRANYRRIKRTENMDVLVRRAK